MKGPVNSYSKCWSTKYRLRHAYNSSYSFSPRLHMLTRTTLLVRAVTRSWTANTLYARIKVDSKGRLQSCEWDICNMHSTCILCVERTVLWNKPLQLLQKKWPVHLAISVTAKRAKGFFYLVIKISIWLAEAHIWLKQKWEIKSVHTQSHMYIRTHTYHLCTYMHIFVYIWHLLLFCTQLLSFMHEHSYLKKC